MDMRGSGVIALNGAHCAFHISRPAEGAILLRVYGADVGEFGDRPFAVLEEMMARGAPVALFVDAGEARGPSVSVSAEWAIWLSRKRARLERVNMLARSPLARLTAKFVQHFSGMEARMRVFQDRPAFDRALAVALADAS